MTENYFQNELLKVVNKWITDKDQIVSQDEAWDLAKRISLIAKRKSKKEAYEDSK